MAARLAGLRPFDKALMGLSVVAAGFLLVDPLILGVVRGYSESLQQVFRSFTDLGKSSWVLWPSALAFIALAALRTRDIGLKAAAAYGYAAQMVAFVFAAVAVAGIAATIGKVVVGRARPKLFDTLGPVTFEPFVFLADYASFPSGHATNICALAAVIAIFWPRLTVPVFVIAAWIAATRFLIGAHYLTDAIAGAALGTIVPYLIRERLARRRWLFARGPDGQIRLRARRLQAWMVREIRANLLTRGRRSPTDAETGSGTR